MASQATTPRSFPFVPVLAGLAAITLIAAVAFYLSRPSAGIKTGGASDEAKAYLPHIALSDVSMQAAENFMKQQVIEVKGKITDNGSRTLKSVDVYCLFYGTTGQEIYRERVPIILPKTQQPLRPGETRNFRLPFDSVPDGWNQALPKMVIAQITFGE